VLVKSVANLLRNNFCFGGRPASPRRLSQVAMLVSWRARGYSAGVGEENESWAGEKFTRGGGEAVDFMGQLSGPHRANPNQAIFPAQQH